MRATPSGSPLRHSRQQVARPMAVERRLRVEHQLDRPTRSRPGGPPWPFVGRMFWMIVAAVLGLVADRLAEPAGHRQQDELADVILRHRRRRPVGGGGQAARPAGRAGAARRTGRRRPRSRCSVVVDLLGQPAARVPRARTNAGSLTATGGSSGSTSSTANRHPGRRVLDGRGGPEGSDVLGHGAGAMTREDPLEDGRVVVSCQPLLEQDRGRAHDDERAVAHGVLGQHRGVADDHTGTAALDGHDVLGPERQSVERPFDPDPLHLVICHQRVGGIEGPQSLRTQAHPRGRRAPRRRRTLRLGPRTPPSARRSGALDGVRRPRPT